MTRRQRAGSRRKSTVQDMHQQARKRSVFNTAPEEELLYSLAADGTRKHIDPVVTHGRFRRVRLVIGWVLVVSTLLSMADRFWVAWRPGSHA